MLEAKQSIRVLTDTKMSHRTVRTTTDELPQDPANVDVSSDACHMKRFNNIAVFTSAARIQTALVDTRPCALRWWGKLHALKLPCYCLHA